MSWLTSHSTAALQVSVLILPLALWCTGAVFNLLVACWGKNPPIFVATPHTRLLDAADIKVKCDLPLYTE